ncbi:NADPH-dependent ferric siderophore reductase, contains FAD-binding and SIP domains [Actinacidiphila alni]|uniref:NADPH-dependent ferric siderophore reductase, contains FAD-binding and SIP domains n=1 Tax=Actinacidiphila alni TaxID=380248 RepID=A0A1I2AUX5_9ACTN|nr:siderophore-interacting protein [Actinacidiphila alni]SFE47636.1 NADPH-dependent ferric siderophore reductase, contains FAD-binding and SIP domains [Actinacidiphila alni]
MPKTSRRLTVHPPTLREVEVVRAVDITPGMRRITLGGAQLRAFTTADGFEQPAFVSPGFDDDLGLYFPYPGRRDPVLPVQDRAKLIVPRDPRPLSRAYTVRRWDPEAGELDVDFVKHGVGAGTAWAYRTQPGDRIHFSGPSTSKAFPTGADWWLVAGDDTALPAIGRLLDELPPDARAQVFIEIAEDAHRQELRELPGVDVTWLVRPGATAGTVSPLTETVRSARWWPGQVFAWLAGEHTAVRDIRRHLVEDRGVPKEDIDFAGYWRRAEVVALENDGAVPDPERTVTPFQKLHDLTELVAPIAIRTAVELGVPDLVSRGVTGVTELAAKAGADERALGKLLRYLHTLDVVTETEPGHYALTPVGDVLTLEFIADRLHPAGVIGREMLGIHGLTESVRTGRPAYASVTGQTFADVRAEQDYEDRHLERLAKFQPALAEPIATSDLLAGVQHLVIHSGGAGAHAREYVAAHERLRVTICALPAQADWLRRDLPATIPDEQQRARVGVLEQSVFEPGPAADAVLISRAFKTLPDADAAHALRRAAENLVPGGRVLLIEEVFDTDALDEHDGEEDLICLVCHGSGLRTGAELDAVIVRAGLTRKAAHTVGLGATVHELLRSTAD